MRDLRKDRESQVRKIRVNCKSSKELKIEKRDKTVIDDHIDSSELKKERTKKVKL